MPFHYNMHIQKQNSFLEGIKFHTQACYNTLFLKCCEVHGIPKIWRGLLNNQQFKTGTVRSYKIRDGWCQAVVLHKAKNATAWFCCIF